jgi:DNA-directed RNA polymerase subunit RPC12/RpoP
MSEQDKYAGYIKFYCVTCQKKLKVKDEYIGRTVQCPKCKENTGSSG